MFLIRFWCWSFCFVVFFFKQKTAYEMRISDWSSDVCSSDLLHDTRNQVSAEVQAAWYAFSQAQEQSQLFRDGIIPQSRQTVESMLAGYQVNKVDFLNLMQSQISLYNFEQQYWRALTQARQALAELAAASGRASTEGKPKPRRKTEH